MRRMDSDNPFATDSLSPDSGTGNPLKVIGASGNQGIDGMLTDRAWADVTIEYSFPTTNIYGYTQLTDLPNGMFGVTVAQQNAAHFALNAEVGVNATAKAGFSVEGFTNLGIYNNLAPDGDDEIRLANTTSASLGTARVADFPGNYITSQTQDNGDVWFGTNYNYTNPIAGNYAWHTTLHEIGHALGLKHSQETGFFGAMPDNINSMEYSVMTYRSYIGASNSGGYTNEAYGYAQSYMMYDIAALQHMYGADFTTNSGNTTYSWNPGSGNTLVNGVAAIQPGANRIFATIWDGGGYDTYDLSAYTTNLSIDLSPGGYSSFSAAQKAYLGGGPNGGYARGNIFNALQYGNDLRSLIEAAVGGSGDDSITGNVLGNYLNGNAGNDTLKGLGGADSLYGGDGNDYLAGGDGNDYLSGGNGANSLYGEAGFDSIYSGDGNDTINAGDHEDYVFAGAGNDLITDDIAMFTDDDDTYDGGAGIDTLVHDLNWVSTVAFNLSTGWATLDGQNRDRIVNIENLTVGGSAQVTGSDVANVLRVNGTGANIINGLGGNDVINAGGGNDTVNGGDGNDSVNAGAGVDAASGGNGNDIFFDDDFVNFDSYSGGAGTDTIDYSLVGFASGIVEINLATGLTRVNTTGGNTESIIGFENANGSQGGETIRGTGVANTLNGNGGDDRLIGEAGTDLLRGGLGRDQLYGGAGFDRFDFNARSETVVGATCDVLTGYSSGPAFQNAGNTEGDRIDLIGIDANETVGGNQTFTFANTQAIGTLRCFEAGGTTRVLGYVDGVAGADFQIDIQDGAVLASTYRAADFFL
jgi:serralysin